MKMPISPNYFAEVTKMAGDFCGLGGPYFTYAGPRCIDLRCHEEIFGGNRRCLCIPPEDRVLPTGTEYKFRPITPKLSLPIGPMLFMHLFQCPTAVPKDSAWIWDQLSKRACGQLVGHPTQPEEAWGIYYKEGWNWFKVWVVLGLGFFPPSILFDILWAVPNHDIQGAFGVASWWMTGATILLYAT
ncbi:hypothetical protein K490DRAFT_60808 [Saccharata proteae CBS 121410]|uniref:Uncharacterized protein n=1 Tax=Saccharata proteae CBS 121410 TaxID=1314787 RepID=A0A9P4I268_9PEZI|nr:hypothetical protein K490DRAFT_60808 [Saccharata proteae CBS 121410]